MTDRFPAPWRIVEIPRGFAVEDAAGLQLGVFYGRSDPNTAGHTGFLTMDEARQLAFNFARLSELSERSPARRDVAKATPDFPTDQQTISDTHHDAVEFPDGDTVLLTSVREGQLGTVLLPARPATSAEAEEQKRVAHIG